MYTYIWLFSYLSPHYNTLLFHIFSHDCGILSFYAFMHSLPAHFFCHDKSNNCCAHEVHSSRPIDYQILYVIYQAEDQTYVYVYRVYNLHILGMQSKRMFISIAIFGLPNICTMCSCISDFNLYLFSM